MKCDTCGKILNISVSEANADIKLTHKGEHLEIPIHIVTVRIIKNE